LHQRAVSTLKKSVSPTTTDQGKLVNQLVAIVVGERKDNSKITTKKWHWFQIRAWVFFLLRNSTC